MTLLERLAETARRQYQENDLPEWLLAGILEITDRPEACSGHEERLRLLLQQVENFDGYAGVGCFGDTVSAAAIEATLKELNSCEVRHGV